MVSYLGQHLMHEFVFLSLSYFMPKCVGVFAFASEVESFCSDLHVPGRSLLWILIVTDQW